MRQVDLFAGLDFNKTMAMRRYFVFAFISLCFLAVLAACAPAATTIVKTQAVKETQVAPAVTPTAAPAVGPTTEVKETQAVQQTKIAPPPTEVQPTQPVVTPTSFLEMRVIELEWPAHMRLGDSDIVRVALIPSKDGYTVSTDFPDHTTQSQNIQVQRPGGYNLYGAARLAAVGFEVSLNGEEERLLPIEERVTWQWSLRPLHPGQQRMNVALLLRWKPVPGSSGLLRESEAFSRSLDVQVDSFFGLSRGQAMTGGFAGLLLGGGLSLFALASLYLPSAAGLRVASPNPAVVIEPAPGLTLAGEEVALLRSLFNRYGRLVLRSEFLSGYSGARAFLALPVHPDGRADAHTIVKIGEAGSVQREYENYEKYVKDTLPPITARIQHVPVTIRGGKKAVLQYTFIGAPGQPPVSLRQALLSDPDPSLLVKLFETFGPNWWMQRRPYTFRLALEYDAVLPTHYVIEPERGRGKLLDAGHPPAEGTLRVGDQVILQNFRSLERRSDGKSLSLLGPALPGRPPVRLRWLSLASPEGASGRVIATRQELLEGFVTGFERFDLPDPLAPLQGILSEVLVGTQSTIHGDLNLENILVGLGGLVWLIDFAMTRDGHTLSDFAHLGASLIAHVIAPQLKEPQEHVRFLRHEGEPPRVYALLDALEEIAARCQFNPTEPREYRLALYLSCLGALKYANLDAFQKHLLYLTAAYLLS